LGVSKSKALVWLGIAAAVALVIAVASLAFPLDAAVGHKLPEDTVALVNGKPISKTAYDSVLRGLQDSAATRGPTAEEKRLALDRMIEDELMIGDGIATDLVRRDVGARHALLGAVVTAARIEAERREPDPVELAEFYRQTRAQYQRPARARLRQLVLRVRDYGDRSSALRRAQLAVQRLRAGQTWTALRRDFEAPGETALSDDLLPIPELRQLVGPLTLEAALALEPGGISEVLGDRSIFRVVQLVERQPPQYPDLSEVRDEVILRFRERAGDVALARKLTELREAATIRLSGETKSPP
jgi:hypothetical protein